jgi:hypothetical protein
MKDVAYTDISTDAPVQVPLTITGTAEGARILLQKVILLMFTDADDTTRYMGGRLYSNYKGANIPRDSGKTLNNFVQSAITSVKDDIKDWQLTQTGLTDDEKLSDIQLVSMDVGADSVSAVISITTVSGATATATTPIGA